MIFTQLYYQRSLNPVKLELAVAPRGFGTKKQTTVLGSDCQG